MPSVDVKAATRAEQFTQRKESTCASSDIGGDRSADNAEFREWSNTEDQTWTKNDVDPISQPKSSHRDGGVAGAAKNRIHHEQCDHSYITGQHDAREGKAMLDHPGRATHQLQ